MERRYDTIETKKPDVVIICEQEALNVWRCFLKGAPALTEAKGATRQEALLNMRLCVMEQTGAWFPGDTPEMTEQIRKSWNDALAAVNDALAPLKTKD